MHNGGIADFHLIKRRLQKELPDAAFDMVQGNTGMSLRRIRPSTRTPWHSLDSEWAFALFLSKVSCLLGYHIHIMTGIAPGLQCPVVHVRNVAKGHG